MSLPSSSSSSASVPLQPLKLSVQVRLLSPPTAAPKTGSSVLAHQPASAASEILHLPALERSGDSRQLHLDIDLAHAHMECRGPA